MIITSLWFTVDDPLSAHRTRSVHRVFAAQSPEAWLAEDVLARVDLVRLEQQVQTNGTDESVIELVKFGLGFENVLKKSGFILNVILMNNSLKLSPEFARILLLGVKDIQYKLHYKKFFLKFLVIFLSLSSSKKIPLTLPLYFQFVIIMFLVQLKKK